MDTKQPATVWDEIIAQASAQKRPTPSEKRRFGLIPLPLRKTPEKTQALAVERSIAEIDPAIRAAIRGLVSGELAWPFMVHGSVGTGKTCAMLALLDYAGGEYWSVSNLCQYMNRAAMGRVEWSKEGRGGTLWPEMIWGRIGKAPLIVLDEIGCRSQVSDAHYEVVKEMIDVRHRKPFAVISNLDLATLGKLYDDRIVSRLSAGTVIELSGPDRRLEE